ncbi:hypothetical protein [Flavobacterium phycosphaerae]|uniref:hypothetical protein n=1 Tax=Flavobacterium phycosphaerae TaxID=2697515 RepID=UPI001389DC25|nr:hypothetical protein [Flavobacterium phycosphaerae]
MKQTLLFLSFFFSFFFGFSQNEKWLHGIVKSGTTPVNEVDLVNLNSKKNVTTDSQGNFSILAQVGDVLFIISKDYVDQKITLTQVDFDQKNLLILLEKKPIELDNVDVVRVQNIKLKLTQDEIDEIKINRQSRAPKVLGVYDGTIVNGVDFINLGQRLIRLFKNKDKEPKKIIPAITFKEYLAANYDTDFYTKKLNLKPEEINLFISFCEADPKAITLVEQQNELALLDFLLTKKDAFKKL